MNELEKLLAKYENELTFVFMKEMPNKLPALLVDKTIYINPTVPFEKSITYILEELGHHETLADGLDISNYNDLTNLKIERRGREWSYKKLVPKEKLIQFIEKRDQILSHEIAEEFGISEDIVDDVVNMYKIKGVL